MPINIIVAHDLNNAIGYKNELLTLLTPDLKRFRELTTGGFVVQGRNTFESIIEMNDRPLPNRTNIVLSTTLNKDEYDCYVFRDIDTLLKEYAEYEGNPDVWIIGGEQIYKQFLPHADKLYITKLDYKFSHADAFFPNVDYSEWEQVEHELFRREPYEYNYSFNVYERKQLNK